MSLELLSLLHTFKDSTNCILIQILLQKISSHCLSIIICVLNDFEEKGTVAFLVKNICKHFFSIHLVCIYLSICLFIYISTVSITYLVSLSLLAVPLLPVMLHMFPKAYNRYLYLNSVQWNCLYIALMLLLLQQIHMQLSSWVSLRAQHFQEISSCR